MKSILLILIVYLLWSANGQCSSG